LTPNLYTVRAEKPYHQGFSARRKQVKTSSIKKGATPIHNDAAHAASIFQLETYRQNQVFWFPKLFGIFFGQNGKE